MASASQASSFSFHCMICFEEFHPEERYPVVLPCGHTYVCHVCANRLDKCMECRMPLFTTVRPKTGNSTNNSTNQQYHHQPTRSSWANARSGLGASSGSNDPSSMHQHHQQPPIKKRLPLPKNVVLLSLIEATELATQDVQKKYSSDEPQPIRPLPNDVDSSTNTRKVNLESRPSVFAMNSMIDADDDEEEKIRVGTSLAVGVAGTYAVATREGLTIVASRPPIHSNSNNSHASRNDSPTSPEEEVDSLVQNMHNESKNDKDSPKKSHTATTTANDMNDDNNNNHHHHPAAPGAANEQSKDCGKLSFGDRVQVVSIDGEWAKLARGYGYVHVTKNSLVKVGGSVDRACKVEAMLRNLSQRRKELRLEQSRIDNQFIRLLNDLQLSLQNDEDLTVIAADAFYEQPSSSSRNGGGGGEVEPYVEIIATDEKKEDDEPGTSGHAATATTPTAASAATAGADGTTEQRNDYDVDIVKPTRLPQQHQLTTTSSSVPQYARPSFVCFAGEVFSGYNDESRDANQPTSSSAPNSPALSMDAALASLFPSASHPSPSALRAGAQAWRERHGRQANQGIDFRTGMSGHMALLSTHAHPHEYLEPVSSYSSSSGYNFPKMSSHTGLTMAKSRGGSSRGLLASLTLPSFGLSPQPEDGAREGVHQTGSM